MFTVLFCSVHPASCWMHWAIRLHHSPVSRQFLVFFPGDVRVFRLRFTMSGQFFLGRPGFLMYPFNSHCVAWWGILQSSIRMTCPNHLSLRSLIMSSSFRTCVLSDIIIFSLCPSMKFPTICVGTYDVLPLELFICVTDSGHRSALSLTKRVIHIACMHYSLYSTTNKQHYVCSENTLFVNFC